MIGLIYFRFRYPVLVKLKFKIRISRAIESTMPEAKEGLVIIIYFDITMIRMFSIIQILLNLLDKYIMKLAEMKKS